MKLLTKTYNLKNEQKQALKIADKTINKLNKQIDIYTKKFKSAKKQKNLKKCLVYSTVITAIEIELETAIRDKKTIEKYYNNLILV